LDDLHDPLTLEELREELCLKFEMMNRRGKLGIAQGQQAEEHALFAGGFKGKCNNCGKIGHKARDCRDKKGNKTNNKADNQGNNSNDGDKNVECFYCKKKGHRISNWLGLEFWTTNWRKWACCEWIREPSTFSLQIRVLHAI